MGFKCYLCGNVSDKIRRVSLHNFPPRTSQNFNQWLAVCELEENDPVKNLRICSCHFGLENLIFGDSKINLKEGAVPKKTKLVLKVQALVSPQSNEPEPEPLISSSLDYEIFKMGKSDAERSRNYYYRKKAAKEAELNRQGLSVKKPIKKTAAERSRAYRLKKKMLSQVNESIPSTSNSRIRTFEPSFQLATTSASTNRPDVSTVSSTGIADHDGPDDPTNAREKPVAEIFCDNNSHIRENEPYFMLSAPIKVENRKRSLSTESNEDIHDDSSLASTSGGNTWDTPTGKKRRYGYPRYINEIDLIDFKNPRSAARTIKFIKDKFEQKSKKLKNLHDKNRSLQKRIQSLENLFSHHKQQRLAFQNTADAFMMGNHKPNNTVDLEIKEEPVTVLHEEVILKDEPLDEAFHNEEQMK